MKHRGLAALAGILLLVGGTTTAALVSGGGQSALSPTDSMPYASGCRDAQDNRGACDYSANCGNTRFDTTQGSTVSFTQTLGGTTAPTTVTNTQTIYPLTSDKPDVEFTVPATTYAYTQSSKTITATVPMFTATTPACDFDGQPRQDTNPPPGCSSQTFHAGADQPYAPGCEPLGALAATDTTVTDTTPTTVPSSTSTTVPTTTAPATTTSPPTTTAPPPPCKVAALYSSFWAAMTASSAYKTWAAAFPSDLAHLKAYRANPSPTQPVFSTYFGRALGRVVALYAVACG